MRDVIQRLENIVAAETGSVMQRVCGSYNYPCTQTHKIDSYDHYINNVQIHTRLMHIIELSRSASQTLLSVVLALMLSGIA